ncbi:hypothetical protein DRE_02954 [Drechslerella stenobrocha 248]|uniref:Uncharacterized protein n=1 Tax=Drechslerella stenobrocha 248 TaxID=1043628 RepID=W7HW50_9PEZI|nr:hypothetical protein DRE_02954 [Drechslerella stenobrocha 248]
MLFRARAVGLVALLVTGRAAAQCTCPCVANRCYTAVAGTVGFAADATLDACRTFMWVLSTVTENTATATEFITSTIAQSTDDITVATVTDTDVFITTATATATFTSTATVTALLQSDSNANAKRRRSMNVVKRQSNDTVPAFATDDCPQATAFASACSCIGITPGGTFYTHFGGTTTETITRTTSITVDETISVTTSTTITTQSVSTTTTTTTITPTATVWAFKIGVSSDSSNGAFAGRSWGLMTESGSQDPIRLNYTTYALGEWFFADTSNKVLHANGLPFSADHVSTTEQLYIRTPTGSAAEVQTLQIRRQ